MIFSGQAVSDNNYQMITVTKNNFLGADCKNANRTFEILEELIISS
jgi:hypothetical protein